MGIFILFTLLVIIFLNFKVCDLAATDRPWACEGKDLAPAYAYSVRTDECYQLGNLENDFAVNEKQYNTECVQCMFYYSIHWIQ